MANSNVPITAGSGTAIDTRTAGDGNHRQVMTVGDDGSDNVATLNTTGTKYALDVNLAGSNGGSAVTSGTITNTVNSAVTATVTNSGNITAVVVGGTFTLLPIVFEASVDGTNWFPIDGTQVDGTGVNINVILPSNSSGPKAWNFYSPGYTNFRVRVTATAGSFTTSPTIYIAQGPFTFEASPTVAPIDGQKASFSVSMNNAAAASATSLSDQVSFWNPVGSGKTIRITYISTQVSLATAAAGQIVLVKRSTLNTGGTMVSVTRTPMDSSDIASVAGGGGAYTAAPTPLGTLVGVVRAYRGQIPVSPGIGIDWTFGNRPSKALVLRPGEAIGLFATSATQTAVATAPTLTGFIEWTEE